VMGPAGARDRAGMVVDEREQVRLLPPDHRAVQRVLCRHRFYADMHCGTLMGWYRAGHKSA
jgi:hypothetical protein